MRRTSRALQQEPSTRTFIIFSLSAAVLTAAIATWHEGVARELPSVVGQIISPDQS